MRDHIVFSSGDYRLNLERFPSGEIAVSVSVGDSGHCFAMTEAGVDSLVRWLNQPTQPVGARCRSWGSANLELNQD